MYSEFSQNRFSIYSDLEQKYEKSLLLIENNKLVYVVGLTIKGDLKYVEFNGKYFDNEIKVMSYKNLKYSLIPNMYINIEDNGYFLLNIDKKIYYLGLKIEHKWLLSFNSTEIPLKRIEYFSALFNNFIKAIYDGINKNYPIKLHNKAHSSWAIKRDILLYKPSKENKYHILLYNNHIGIYDANNNSVFIKEEYTSLLDIEEYSDVFKRLEKFNAFKR